MTIAGGCRCGAVRYTLALEALPLTYACHCLECQTWTGTAFSQQILLPEEGIEVSGPVILYEREGTGGRMSRQRICGVCHTRIYNSNTIRPGVVVVRGGTLDDSHLLTVAMHIWTKRKQGWIALPDGTPSWEEGAPPEAYEAALRWRQAGPQAA